MPSCEVTMNTPDCESPYDLDGPLMNPIRTRCFACGGSCCKKCSALVTYCGHRCRLCADCLEDHRDELNIPAEIVKRLGLTKAAV